MKNNAGYCPKRLNRQGCENGNPVHEYSALKRMAFQGKTCKRLASIIAMDWRSRLYLLLSGPQIIEQSIKSCLKGVMILPIREVRDEILAHLAG